MAIKDDVVDKIKAWLFPGVLSILLMIGVRTMDRLDKVSDKVDVINTTVQELNVKQTYNDKEFDEYAQRLGKLEQDHTLVMRYLPRIANNN